MSDAHMVQGSEVCVSYLLAALPRGTERGGRRREGKASFPRLSGETEHPGTVSSPTGDVSRVSPSVNP